MPKARESRPKTRAVAKRPSQSDVAKLAGVSPGVVSAVINNRDYGSIRISDTTRERVRAAVRELGYVPNIAARNLASGSSRLIGVFTFDQLFPMKQRNFYHEFLVGIEEAADDAEYNLLLVTGSKDEENRRSIYAHGVNGLQLADGALFLGTHEKQDEIVRLAGEGFPFVFVGRREFEGCEVSYVAADYRSGVFDLVQRAAAFGHRKIAMLIRPGSKEFQPPGRRTGFVEGVRAAGLSATDCQIHDMEEFIKPQLTEKSEATATMNLDLLVERIKEGHITAVFSEYTELANEVVSRCSAAGLRIPEDVSVVGLYGGDGVPPDSLTQLMVPRYEMGHTAARTLLELLADPTMGPVQKTLSCGEPGGSTFGPAPTRSGRRRRGAPKSSARG